MESNYQSSNQNELSSPIIKIILNDFDVEVQLFPTPYIVKELSTFNNDGFKKRDNFSNGKWKDPMVKSLHLLFIEKKRTRIKRKVWDSFLQMG